MARLTYSVYVMSNACIWWREALHTAPFLYKQGLQILHRGQLTHVPRAAEHLCRAQWEEIALLE